MIVTKGVRVRQVCQIGGSAKRDAQRQEWTAGIVRTTLNVDKDLRRPGEFFQVVICEPPQTAVGGAVKAHIVNRYSRPGN